jgi:general stress protein 26
LSRREQIRMSLEEVAEFIDSQRVVICASHGPRGWPHLMPLWYVVRDGDIWAWTYAKSQKTRNLERDSRATLQIEDGEQYHELRGVMIEARATIHRQTETVAALGSEIFARYAGGAAADAGGAAADAGGAAADAGGAAADADRPPTETVRAQAAKRVGLQFKAERIASWDHRKLGGTY